MAYCDQCGNFDDFLSFEKKDKNDPDYQPELYYYWDSPIEEDYDWRDAVPHADCLCEICFDILNSEKKIKWNCASVQTGTQSGCFLAPIAYNQYIQTNI